MERKKLVDGRHKNEKKKKTQHEMIVRLNDEIEGKNEKEAGPKVGHKQNENIL